MQTIRISGDLQGDSGADLAPNSEVGFAICYLTQGSTIRITDLGIYGSTITISGMSNVGIIGYIPQSTTATMQNILITYSAEEKFLINQI